MENSELKLMNKLKQNYTYDNTNVSEAEEEMPQNKS